MLSLAMVGVLPGNISNQSAANNQNGLLAENTKLVHGVDDAEERVHGLCLFTNHGLVDLELEVVVVEVLLHLLAVHVEDVGIHDCQGSAPALVAVGKLLVLLVENTVHEDEVIFDLLVTLDVETILGLVDGSLKIRHVCRYVCECVRAGLLMPDGASMRRRG